MSEVFFISDTHFGHRGIITFSGTKPFRPFATIEEHDAAGTFPFFRSAFQQRKG
jgi:calcineurin-like phosphoesterase family protein